MRTLITLKKHKTIVSEIIFKGYTGHVKKIAYFTRR